MARYRRIRALLTDFFVLFMLRLTLDAQRRHGTGLEPLERNLAPARFADPERALGDAVERFVDFLEQLLFALLEPEHEVLIGHGRGLIAQVRQVLAPDHQPLTDHHPRFVEEGLPLLLQLATNLREISLFGRSGRGRPFRPPPGGCWFFFFWGSPPPP